jgi:hypothetical protein
MKNFKFWPSARWKEQVICTRHLLDMGGMPPSPAEMTKDFQLSKFLQRWPDEMTLLAWQACFPLTGSQHLPVS